jgi:hypothetical protein
MAQSTWKKSTASMVKACALRNRRQLVSVARSGAGGICRSLRRDMINKNYEARGLATPPPCPDRAIIRAVDEL